MNSAKQDIDLSGGMDLENDIKNVKPGDYLYALNFRNVFTENQIDGAGENISSNIEVPYVLPDGVNKCIGAYQDAVNNTVFYHIWNSNGNHQLLRYYASNTTNIIQPILSGSILNSTEWDYVTHSNLVGNLYYWVEGDNPQRQINVDKANNTDKIIQFKLCFGPKETTLLNVNVIYRFVLGTTDLTYNISIGTGDYSRSVLAAYVYSALTSFSSFTTNFDIENKGEYLLVTSKVMGIWDITVTPPSSFAAWYKAINWYPSITEKVLDVVAWGAWGEPDTALVNIPSFSENFLNGKSYQFRTKVYYDDGQVSVLSKMSRMQYNDIIPLATLSPSDYSNYIQNYATNNCIKINYGDGGRIKQSVDLISKVEIFVRNTNTESFRSCAVLHDYELDGIYYFFNNTNGSTVGAAEDAKAYQAIPINSKVQEVVNNKLFYGNNLVGYDSVNVNAILDSFYDTPQTWDTTFIQRAKMFGNYRFGIVYFDRFGRNNFVNRNSNMELTIQPINVLGWNTSVDRVYQTWSIYSQPPEWAVTYAWVRTKDLTQSQYTKLIFYPTGGNLKYFDKDGNEVLWSSGIVYSVEFEKISTDSGYQYTKGDMLRLVKYPLASSNAYTGNVVTTIISYDSATNKMKIIWDQQNDANVFDLLDITNLSLISGIDYFILGEAFSPYSVSENELYYEFYETYPILDAGTPNRRHSGGWQGQDQDIDTNTPALGYFYFGWDTFQLSTKVGGTGNIGFFLERPYLNETNQVEVSGIGRATAVIPNNKQVRLAEDIAFSDVYNIGATTPSGESVASGYNGFGTWEALNHRNLPTSYGELNLLKNIDNILVAVCRYKSFSVYVDQGVLVSPVEGATTISTSDKVIGAVRHLNGSYGTINPESWAKADNLLFWWDAYSGVVCQYSSNGIEEVSRYKAYSYFSKLGRLGVQADPQTYKVLGVVHVPFNEYIMSFSPITVNSVEYNPFTIAFNFAVNQWKTYYSYIPEMMCGINTNIVTFLSGQLFLHTLSTSRNVFYGGQYNLEVLIPVNAYPSVNKTFQSLSYEGTDYVNFPVITTPPNQFNPSGQSSEILVQDIEFMNGSYWAPFLKNKITPNFATEAEALIEGDELQSQVMTLLLSATNNNLFWIKNLHVYFIADQLTNQ